MKKTPNEILGVPIESVLSVFPHWHLKNDLSGRPVIYKVYGKTLCATKLRKLTGGNFDRVINYHLWEQEVKEFL